MPSCYVRSCKNRSEKGFRLFRVPREKKRKEIWCRFIKRTDLSDRSVICEAHFTDDQYEQNRVDGRKLLRRDAVPTLFGPSDGPTSEIVLQGNVSNKLLLFCFKLKLSNSKFNKNSYEVLSVYSMDFSLHILTVNSRDFGVFGLCCEFLILINVSLVTFLITILVKFPILTFKYSAL
ncbi:hypothetical protein ABEB36_013642 [Hypothenemus hampei]|uniref:THAP-type domain-containing protein n=1 Tax=Hypothenemus hampei TaxID=57062 RepID=A0ABD1E5T7_HYPHA